MFSDVLEIMSKLEDISRGLSISSAIFSFFYFSLFVLLLSGIMSQYFARDFMILVCSDVVPNMCDLYLCDCTYVCSF